MAIIVSVDDPDRMLRSHLFIDNDFFHILASIGFLTHAITDIDLRPISRVKCDYRPLTAVPFLRIRPIYLNIRLFQRVQIFLRGHRTTFGIPGCLRHGCKMFGNELFQRTRIRLGADGTALRVHTDSRTRRFEKVLHQILLIVAVP